MWKLIIMFNLLTRTFVETISYDLSSVTSHNVSIEATSVFFMKGLLLLPEFALDGHNYTNHSNCQCCASTTDTLNPSYQLTLDVSRAYRLSNIVALGRTDDTHGENLRGLTVWLGSRDSEPVAVVSEKDTSLYASLGDVPFQNPIILELTGRFDKFILCELMVYSSNVVSEGSVVTLSSTLELPSDYFWYGHNAVRGDVGSNFSLSCQCCASTTVQDNPWLLVDLGQKHAITFVDIICLNNGGDWLAGVDVYMEKQISLPSSTPVHTLNGLSCKYYITIQPIVVSQYVTLRRIGYNCQLTVCEVTVYAKDCDKDRWRLDCLQSCGHCENNSPCQDSDGHCHGCQPGYIGVMCDKEVVSFEKAVETFPPVTGSVLVDSDNNTCTNFSNTYKPWVEIDLGTSFYISEIHLNGYFSGESFLLYLSQHSCSMGEPTFKLDNVGQATADGQRTEVTITMPAVNPSVRHVTLIFTGLLTSLTLCEILIVGSDSCPAGFYGPSCCTPCLDTDCRGGRCDPVTGHCTGCPDGYTGAECSQVCPEGVYGEGCRMRCGYCEGHLPCNPINGSCTACIPGFTGPLCQTDSTTGVNVSRRLGDCNCVDDAHCTETGECPDGRCAPGWIGPTCSDECPAGFYGIECSESCSQWESLIILGAGGAGVGILVTVMAYNLSMFIDFISDLWYSLASWRRRRKKKRRKQKKLRKSRKMSSESADSDIESEDVSYDTDTSGSYTSSYKASDGPSSSSGSKELYSLNVARI